MPQVVHKREYIRLWGDPFIGPLVSNKMTRDNEIPAIFSPRRVRAPSVVVTTDESLNGSCTDGTFTNILHSSNPQINQLDTISLSNERIPDGSQITTKSVQSSAANANAVNEMKLN